MRREQNEKQEAASSSEFNIDIRAELQLDSPLSDQHAGWLVASPKFLQLLCYGSVKLLASEKNNYNAMDDLMQTGHKIKIGYQLFDHTEDYVISDCTISRQQYALEIELAQESKLFKALKLSIRYNPDSQTAAIRELGIGRSGSEQIIKKSLKIILKRLNFFANNPELALNEFQFITDLNYQIKADAPHADYSHTVTTSMVVANDLSNSADVFSIQHLKAMMNCPDIFSNDEGSQFKMNLPGAQLSLTKFSMNAVEQAVTFTVNRIDNDTMLLSSSSGVHNFHRLGFQLQREAMGDQTKIHLSVLFSHSALIGFANTVMSFFAKPKGDISKMMLPLYMAAMAKLQTLVRHNRHHFEKNLELTVLPENDSGLATSQKVNSSK